MRVGHPHAKIFFICVRLRYLIRFKKAQIKIFGGGATPRAPPLIRTSCRGEVSLAGAASPLPSPRRGEAPPSGAPRAGAPLPPHYYSTLMISASCFSQWCIVLLLLPLFARCPRLYIGSTVTIRCGGDIACRESLRGRSRHLIRISVSPPSGGNYFFILWLRRGYATRPWMFIVSSVVCFPLGPGIFRAPMGAFPCGVHHPCAPPSLAYICPSLV